MDFEELAPLMGLTSDEAKVYRHVLNHESASAPQVARLLGKTRSRAYEVLRRLVDHGLMIEQAGRPLQYIARPLHESLAAKQAEYVALAEQLAIVHENLKAAEPGEELEVTRKVTLFHGAHTLAKEAHRLATNPTKRLVIVGEPCFDGGPRLRSDMFAAIKTQAESGVDVRVYLPETAPDGLYAEVAKVLGKAATRYDYSEFPQLSGVATDQCAIFLVPESGKLNSGELLGVRVQSPVIGQFVCQAVVSLLHPVRSAPPLGQSKMEAYIHAVTKARSIIHLFLGAGWRDLRSAQEFAEVGAAYWAIVKRGVRVKVIVDDDVMELLFLHSLRMTEGAEVRVASWIPAWCCIVDEQRPFQAVKTKEQTILGRESEDPAEVQLYLEIFDQLWHKSRPLAHPG